MDERLKLKEDLPPDVAARFTDDTADFAARLPAWSEFEFIALCYGYNPFTDPVRVAPFLGYDWHEVAAAMFQEYHCGIEIEIARAGAAGTLNPKQGTMLNAWHEDAQVTLYSVDEAVAFGASFAMFPFELEPLAERYVVSLGTGETKQVEASIPKAKPGPKPKNTVVVEYAEQLIAEGMQQTQAVIEAAEKFGAKQNSIERSIRRRRQRQ